MLVDWLGDQEEIAHVVAENILVINITKGEMSEYRQALSM